MSETPDSNSAVFTLAEILACCKQEQCCDATLLTSINESMLQKPLVGVCTDSRKIKKDTIFVALNGENFDGHQYVHQAATAGAALAIVEKDIDVESVAAELIVLRVKSTLETLGALAHCHRKKLSCKFIGITGSYGKTTTRAMITVALETELKVLSTQENYNNEIGVAQTLLQLTDSHQAAVIEMGMRGSGQIDYLAKMAAPDIGVITNVGPQHIELLGSVEKIAAAKAELVQRLPAAGVAVLPRDSASYSYLKEQAAGKIVTFGQNKAADYCAAKIEMSDDGGTRCDLQTPGENITMRLSLPGAHNMVNAAAAMAVADAMNINRGAAANALFNVQIPGARMKLRKYKRYTLIDDCYNAGPDSMHAALEVLQHFSHKGRRVAVLGSMLELGEFSQEKHQQIGEQAASFVNVLVCVGEETKVLLEAAAGNKIDLHWFADATDAAAWMKKNIQEGDVVLIKGSRGIGLEKVVEVLHD